MLLVEYLKKQFAKKRTPTTYQRVDIGDDVSDDFKELEDNNRKLLRLNGVNTNKIRFVFMPTFLYDIDNNIVNPKYLAFFPLRDDNRFDKDAPVIEIGKPKNIVGVSVNSYKVDDNYEFIAELVKKTKKGIVIYIVEHEDAVRFDGTTFSYEFGVDSEELRLRDLDEIEIVTEEIEEIL